MECHEFSRYAPDYRTRNMKTAWNEPPIRPLLSGNDVHIWRAVLDVPGWRVQEFKEKLSVEERIKSEKFRFERDRSRFIAARGILRLILGAYLGIVPNEIRFCYEIGGKPRLLSSFATDDIQFNLSHSEELALYGFTRGHEVGVDIECIREMSEMEEIVEQLYSRRYRDLLSTVSPNEKQEIFFHWWTRKEAFAKGTGSGLTHPVDTFDALPVEGKSAGSVWIMEAGQQGQQWSMWDVSPADGFAGTVLVEGEGLDVQYWQWPG